MKIQRKDKLIAFAVRHADVVESLRRWQGIVESACWSSHADVKSTFPDADYIGRERYVFNIKGNAYRLVVVAIFTSGVLWIRYIGTHAEYNRIDCRTI
jgi:mRNA interferase HigB